jgi:hypothetical protein
MESAWARVRAMAAVLGLGVITIWRKEMVAGRLPRLPFCASKNRRISCSVGETALSLPAPRRLSISRFCRAARRCWSVSQRRYSSGVWNPAFLSSLV